jgi:peptidoglycan/LPS O-acetylase OafA/YrhL
MIAFASEKCERPDWRFEVVEGLSIPEKDGVVDYVSFFSVITHLRPQESLQYLHDAKRTLKPGGKIVASFLDRNVKDHHRLAGGKLRQLLHRIIGDGVTNTLLDEPTMLGFGRHLGMAAEFIPSPMGTSCVFTPKPNLLPRFVVSYSPICATVRSGYHLYIQPDRPHSSLTIREGCQGVRQHANSFDLVRLLAAVLVLWSHQYGLMGLSEPTAAVLQIGAGGLGLYIFFAVSGYLNTISAEHHRSVAVFLFNRALRIYPALAVCTAFTVVLGLFAANDLQAFLGTKLISYIAKNTTLLFGIRTSVPGVFEHSPFPGALNGSLWSLPYEVKMYIVLALALAVARYNLLLPVVVFVSASLIAALSVLDVLPAPAEGNWWINFSTLFFTGSMVAAARSFVGLPIAVGALIAVAAAFASLGQYSLMCQLLLVAVVIVVGCIRLPKWLRPPLDLSYGVYLYAFPVQQISTMLFADFWPALAFSAVITFALALLSALFVDRPALTLKDLDPTRLISSIWTRANRHTAPNSTPHVARAVNDGTQPHLGPGLSG